MPRKAKETIENEEILENVEKKKTNKSVATKKTASSSTKTSTKKTTKKTTKKDGTAKKTSTNSSNRKKTTTKLDSKEKKSKSTAKKSSTTTKKKTTRTKKVVATPAPEYYDLPYHYDQTVVKLLAQTPKTLFVYWDVSNADKEKLEKQFGTNFFDNTVPFLRVKNETSGYFFDVDVDDFANGWYITVEDSKSHYSIELLRKQRPYTEKVIEEPVYITSSNRMETPNDRILFNTNYTSVAFKNVKTNEVTSKNMSSVISLKNLGKIYNIYDLYKKIYKNEDVRDLFDLTNPSSGNPTSTFK